MRERLIAWVLRGIDEPEVPERVTLLRHPIWWARLVAYPVADVASLPETERRERAQQWSRFFEEGQ